MRIVDPRRSDPGTDNHVLTTRRTAGKSFHTMSAAHPTQAQMAESLLAFWADGGVDAMLLDEPVDRIAAGRVLPPQRVAAPMAAAPARTAPRQPDISDAVAKAHALASVALDIDALAAAIANFDGCLLRFEGAASQAVVYRGNPSAPLMVIGEAPGADEDALGQPFVGRAGKLLDRMLAAAGIAERVLITNTVFWRPPGNRTPTAAEQAVCAPFVERLIALVRPRLLLLAGGAPTKSLLKREDGILSLRGRWIDWTSADGLMTLPALPTLHPAFLLRQPGAKKHAWNDLLTLTERLDRSDEPQ